MTSIVSAGTAEFWGPLWGGSADDWAETEAKQLPTYEEAIRRVGITAGDRVLDIGCGSGVFLRAAADLGARVAGLDASGALLEVARSRVPEADLRVGEMQALPYDDDEFDVVTGFNSFFFAADMVAALREAARVARPGGAVVIQVFGRPERSSLDAMKEALQALLPEAPRPSSLWEEGVLERAASEAGLAPERAFVVSWAYEYADEESLATGMLSAGSSVAASAAVGEDVVRRAILTALEPWRTSAGGYRLENEWHFLIARA